MPKTRGGFAAGFAPDEITLEGALTLLSLPREVGAHPEDGVMIEAGIGRYGPFVKHGTLYANLPEVAEVFEIGINRAVDVLAEKAAKRGGGRAAATPLKELGEHPDGGAINIMDGRYGPYVKWEKINATLPKGTEPADVNLDMALELIAEKAAKSGKKKAPAKKKAATKKTTAKKTTAKKPAAKKTTKKAAAEE